jgi:cyclopropane-fatty-acyl-phospholipid synthase
MRRYPEAHLPLTLRLLVRAADRLHYGKLELVSPDRGHWRFEGRRPGPSARLVLRNPAALGRVLRGGDVAFAEAYMDGDWDTPDLAELLELLHLNRQAFDGLAAGRLLARLGRLASHLRRRNTRRGSRRNIAYHYDLGNAFYAAWLDPTLTYSCALFERQDEHLEQAQRNKYDRMLRRLDIHPGQHLLEIGSGWGGFAIHAAAAAGCRVTSITLSERQFEEARKRVRAAGLEQLVELRLQDYRDVTECYDRVVSIEMFEAVGEQYWPDFFRTIHDRLRPGGIAALQVITIADAAFADYRRGVDFIQKYIFPGGMLCSPAAFATCVKAAGLLQNDRQFFGEHYARTLAEWDRRVFAAGPDLRAQGFDNRFLRMWHYYLAYCQAGFRTGHVDLMQTTLVRPA